MYTISAGLRIIAAYSILGISQALIKSIKYKTI